MIETASFINSPRNKWKYEKQRAARETSQGSFFKSKLRSLSCPCPKSACFVNKLTGSSFYRSDGMVSLMMTTNVFAGSDTTSTTMRGIFLCLMQNPRVLAKLQAELQQCRASDNASEVFTSEEAESCQYLQAVIYEGMRVFPAVGLVLDRDTPQEGMTICGRFVPGGVSPC
jgi:hypothetical protein